MMEAIIVIIFMVAISLVGIVLCYALSVIIGCFKYFKKLKGERRNEKEKPTHHVA